MAGKRADAQIPDKEDLATAVAKLSPEEARFFVAKLEALMKKRKIQITGYLVAMFVFIGGMFGALLYYGSHDGFVGWVFVIPFGFVGVIFYAFGRWAARVGRAIKVEEKAPK